MNKNHIEGVLDRLYATKAISEDEFTVLHGMMRSLIDMDEDIQDVYSHLGQLNASLRGLREDVMFLRGITRES
jgi:hypothetical protein